jgi:hypothetical protein
MKLFKRAHFRGMAHELMRQNVISFPSEKHAEEAADEVADEYSDEEIPPVTDEEGLSEEEASEALNKLVEVAEAISEKSGHYHDTNLNKMAAAVDLRKVASAHAMACIQKAAEEGPSVPGQGQPIPAIGATAETGIDNSNNPSSEVIVPKGQSSMDATPGAVGAQTVRPDQPGAQEDSPPEDVADVKISQLLSKIAASVEAPNPSGDGTPSSHGGNMPGREDLRTNIGMGRDMIVGQGQTNIPEPAMPVPLRPNPAAAGVTKQDSAGTDVQSDVKKAAQLLSQTEAGRKIISKMAQAQEAEDYAMQTQRAEEEKAASVLMRALGNVAHASR